VTGTAQAGARPPLGPPVPDGMAVASLVLGIVSIILVPVISGILAVVFGHVSNGTARREGRRSSQQANWGLILGYLGLVLWVIVIVVIVVNASHGSSYADCVNNAIGSGVDPSLVCTP
jgi:uncharacterized membrane protein